MVVIIRSINPFYRRAGLTFSAQGAPFELLDAEEDRVGEPGEPIGIGRKTYAVLTEEAKKGMLSIIPESVVDAPAAARRIAELEGELAAAQRRIADLEAELQDKPKKK